MEVSSVSTNPNYPDGEDYGNRTGNMNHVETSIDPRSGRYIVDPRGQSYYYPQQQYQPEEQNYVVSRGSCSHCQTHCCQRPMEFQYQPIGSRGERSERYVGDVRNESSSVGTEAVREVHQRIPILHDQGMSPHHESCNVQQEALAANEREVVSHPQQVTECCSIPYQQRMCSACFDCGTSNNSYHPVNNYNNDSHQYETVALSPAFSQTASPLISGETNSVPLSSIPQTRSFEPNIVQPDPSPCVARSNIAKSVPVLESEVPKDSVESLMASRKPSPTRIPGIKEEKKIFNPSSMTHLNFKEKQLAMSAVKKAAVNMKCIQMFEDKDKMNCGKIGRRDFQMVMDRLGVLSGMSSREIDAVFKGFSTQTDTEIDYRKFSEACKHVLDNEQRLARMAQK